MQGIPSNLQSRMRNALSKTGIFMNQASLLAIFMEERLKGFETNLPAGSTINERIDNTLHYLSGKSIHTTSENVLWIFLLEVANREPAQASSHYELKNLAQEWLDHVNKPADKTDNTPVKIEQSAASTPASIPEPSDLLSSMGTKMSLNDIEVLCMSLKNVQFDNLSGSTVTSKSMALIQHLQRRNRYPELIVQLSKSFPHVLSN